VASLALSTALACRVTSLVAGKDVVPRLSVAAANRLSWRLAAQRLASGQRDGEPLPPPPGGGHGEPPEDAAPWADGAVVMIDLSGRSAHLLPAGRCLHLRRLSRGGGGGGGDAKRGPVLQAVHCTAFADIRLGARMLSDHRPSVYARALDALLALQAADAAPSFTECRLDATLGAEVPDVSWTQLRGAIASATAGTAEDAHLARLEH
jgi:hypothetical protein